jgi:hypothetical protein
MKKNLNSNNLYIFDKYVNNDYKSIPFFERVNNIGDTKYFPPVIKEWKNSIYVFNHNNLINLPTYNLDINSLIKSYFNLYFKKEFLKSKFRFNSNKRNRLSMNKIFVSKAEIKHTNSKAIITVYTFNREKIVLLNKINMLKKSYLKNIILLLYKSKILYNNLSNKHFNNKIKDSLYKELKLLRRLKLKLSLNKYKFEEIFLYKLSKLISKIYKKKIELNVINLKSIIFNSDLFTKVLTLKLKKKRAHVIRMMSFILNKAVLPKVNRTIEKGTLIKSIDFNLIENKYKNLNLKSIIKGNNLDKLLNELYYSVILNKNLKKGYSKIYETIFNSIKYKNMGGVKLEVKGRLTKRYRADRAIFKIRLKGGLKNIDSSYKGLSSVNMRGYVKPNIEYSIFTSKRRIGAFAVKGWISGK